MTHKSYSSRIIASSHKLFWKPSHWPTSGSVVSFSLKKVISTGVTFTQRVTTTNVMTLNTENVHSWQQQNSKPNRGLNTAGGSANLWMKTCRFRTTLLLGVVYVRETIDGQRFSFGSSVENVNKRRPHGNELRRKTFSDSSPETRGRFCFVCFSSPHHFIQNFARDGHDDTKSVGRWWTFGPARPLQLLADLWFGAVFAR